MSNAKRKEKLTKTLILSLEPREKEHAVWDTSCPGFHVRVMPSGKKTFYVFYRNSDRKPYRKSLGDVRSTTVDSARRKAIEVIADIGRGYDQFKEQQKRKAVPTLSEVWPEYLEQHAKPKKAASSVREDTRLWTLHLEPQFGKKRVNEISTQAIRRWHSERARTPYEANRALSLLSKLMSFSSDHLDRNPCRDVSKFPEEPRTTELSEAQVRSIFEAIENDPDRGAATLVRLLLFTGARRGEAMKARWTEFDMDTGLWTVPSQHIKGGQRHALEIRRALPNQILQDLREWRKLCPSPFGLVFPSPQNKEKPRADLKSIWTRIRRKTGLSSLRIHDLRHNFAMTAIRNDVSLEAIGDALGHRDRQTTMRYARYDKNSRHRVAAVVGDALSSLYGPAVD